MDVVLLIHGIRTDAAWTSMVRSIIEAETTSRVVVLRYGYFDLLRFLFPLGTRSAPRKRLARLIQNVRADEPTARVSVIAHSFGTYTITRILAEHRYIRINRLIMCGSVVPEDFRWEDVAAQLERPVLNECGTLDVWPIFASLITVGYGARAHSALVILSFATDTILFRILASSTNISSERIGSRSLAPASSGRVPSTAQDLVAHCGCPL